MTSPSYAPPHAPGTVPRAVPVYVVPQRPGRGLQVAGFVCGLLALIFGLLGFFTFILWVPLGVLGLIFGLVGVSKAKRVIGAPTGLGRAGWILALVGMVIGIAAWNAQAESLDSNGAPAVVQEV
jgi:hypothetical protein